MIQVSSGTCTNNTHKIDTFDFELVVASHEGFEAIASWDIRQSKFRKLDHVLLKHLIGNSCNDKSKKKSKFMSPVKDRTHHTWDLYYFSTDTI